MVLMHKFRADKNMLLIQDIDGVCIPLVKDPLKRTLDKEYIFAASKFKNEFAVLTCGEHEGFRGVNRIIERTIGSKEKAKSEGLYLPGLAACGVEYQDKFGNTSLPGLQEKEILFLKEVPKKMKALMNQGITKYLPWLETEEKENLINQAVCDTRFSPAINLNGIFNLIPKDVNLQIKIQKMLEAIMSKIIQYSEEQGLKDSFHLHISPNYGTRDNKELCKYSKEGDVGTTDIQLIIKGALKQSGVLLLLNKYINSKFGYYPFESGFNVRSVPTSIDRLIELIVDSISIKDMPTIVGVGDTVTSIKDPYNNKWLRGGSDRDFLTLIQELGKKYEKDNQIILVDSSHGEVDRPSVKETGLSGISDAKDNLKFNLIMENGPKEYIEWIVKLSQARR